MNEPLGNPDCKPAPSYEYEIHPLALMFPAMEGEAFDALVEDIAARGLLHPITLHKGKILDGRNRYNAAKAAGYKFTDRDFRELSPSLDPEAFVISANMQRRQLSAEQKREFIAKQIESKPDASDRAIAKLCGCEHKTVAAVRKGLKERLEDFQRRWEGLNAVQRQGFVVAVRDDLVKLLAA
jgi:ParB-like nuclease domain